MIKKIIINEENLKPLIHLIHKRLGIVVHHHQLGDLKKVLVSACEKFNLNTNEYIEKIKNSPNQSPFIEHLVLGVTVGETYFFRDKNQMNILKNKILPEIILNKRNKNNLSLKIWSAGCSSGEEIYSIVMLLHEILPDMNKWTLHFLGTDINTFLLQKALARNYSEWSMRSIDEYFKNKYFKYDDKRYILNKKLSDNVTFSYLNLNENSYPSIFNGTNAQDLIMCRNVLIYFDPDHINRIFNRLSSCLVPGGYLLLGASDPIKFENTNLIYHHQYGSLFSRVEVGDRSKIEIKSHEKKYQPEKIIELVKHEVNKINDKPKLDCQYIKKLITESKWQEILDILETHQFTNNDMLFIYNIKATALANLGKLDQAENICKECISLKQNSKNIYFTYAMILIEKNKLNEAEEFLKKVIYLDHKYTIAHFQLGLLLLKANKIELGIKSLRNALHIAELKSPYEEVEGSQGLIYGDLSVILKHEINIYSSLGKILC